MGYAQRQMVNDERVENWVRFMKQGKRFVEGGPIFIEPEDWKRPYPLPVPETMIGQKEFELKEFQEKMMSDKDLWGCPITVGQYWRVLSTYNPPSSEPVPTNFDPLAPSKRPPMVKSLESMQSGSSDDETSSGWFDSDDG